LQGIFRTNQKFAFDLAFVNKSAACFNTPIAFLFEQQQRVGRNFGNLYQPGQHAADQPLGYGYAGTF
jgi:hypothetical protein